MKRRPVLPIRDVWRCTRCSHVLKVGWKSWFSGHSACPYCKARALKTRRRTITAATTSSTGLDEVTTHCLHCNKDSCTTVVSAMISADTSSASGYDSGGGGGDSGGSSSGGGSSGSW